jgi:YHS domain-containing protein
MNVMKRIPLSAIVSMALVVVAGCNRDQAGVSNKTDAPAAQGAASKDHGHEVGPHGGPLVEWGEGEFHAEFTVDHNTREATIYILGADAKQPKPITTDKVLLSIKQPLMQLELKPLPHAGESDGLSSRYVARHDVFATERSFAGSISAVVNGKPYIGDFQEKEHEGGHGTGASVDAKEAALFLTPGGVYTDADIKANGGVVPSIKYKNFKSAHDFKPKRGDKICPITLTKANDKLTWVVNGKTYEFCCPPCLEEFVQMAKERPTELKDPAQYVKE